MGTEPERHPVYSLRTHRIERPDTGARFQMLCHRFKYCLRQRMCLKQMPEVQERRLVGNSVAAKLEMTERTHRLDVVSVSSAPGSDRLYHCCKQ